MTSRSVLAVAGAVGALMASLAFVFPDHTFTAPVLLFWLVVVAAGLCLLASLALTGVAWRRDFPELGYLGGFYCGVSILPLVHGLTVPGVLYGDNTATAAAVFWAVPCGLIALVPLVFRRRNFGRAVGRRWRVWWSVCVAGYAALAAVMLALPDAVPVPAMGSTSARIAVVAVYGATVLAALRQVRLARIAGNPGPAILAPAFILVGSSSLVFLAPGPWSPHFWMAHVLDIVGVFVGTIGGALVYRRESRSAGVLSAVFTIDPHAALELGLAPAMKQFVADLDRKDPTTRDHAVRTAELAVDVAAELGLRPEEIRDAGLVALMHDIGKVAVPTAILTKPDRLTADEFAVMRSHAAHGAAMLSVAPGLERLAEGVGAHHERFDGHGYPRELAGRAIPLTARICAACDAFDAMSATRHYRVGMPTATVRGVIEEHRGSQWDPDVVDALLRVVGRRPWSAEPRTVLREVGRGDARLPVDHGLDCDCVPAGGLLEA